MSILITGGAGYIGSHTLVVLSEAGYDFVVYDNLSNSSKESIKRVEKIINKSISFEEGDIRDKKLLKIGYRFGYTFCWIKSGWRINRKTT